MTSSSEGSRAAIASALASATSASASAAATASFDSPAARRRAASARAARPRTRASSLVAARMSSSPGPASGAAAAWSLESPAVRRAATCLRAALPRYTAHTRVAAASSSASNVPAKIPWYDGCGWRAVTEKLCVKSASCSVAFALLALLVSSTHGTSAALAVTRGPEPDSRRDADCVAVACKAASSAATRPRSDSISAFEVTTSSLRASISAES